MIMEIGNLEQGLNSSVKALQNLRKLRDRTYYQVDLELSTLFDKQETQLQRTISNISTALNSLKNEIGDELS